MPIWDFSHMWDESEYVHFAHVQIHRFAWPGPYGLVQILGKYNMELGYLQCLEGLNIVIRAQEDPGQTLCAGWTWSSLFTNVINYVFLK